MNHNDFLAAQFEEHRPHLRMVAYRTLGSISEADDAVQEAWIRASAAGSSGVDNIAGWLTTIVARVSLNLLRASKSRAEVLIDAHTSAPRGDRPAAVDPAEEAALAESVGLAMLVVLDTLGPAERLAFVLHDMFAVSFDEIAEIIERTPASARQLASRARRRVRGTRSMPDVDFARQRQVVDAYLSAARGGDFDALLSLLDPDVVLRADTAASATDTAREVRGALAVVRRAVTFTSRASVTAIALVNGGVGVVVAPVGRLLVVFVYEFTAGKISGIEVVTDPTRFAEYEIAVLEE
ncbi:sigma-70 family RNA polymerase sigma factor [Antrihabitans sp. NCIMB 15449]|uniref:Sigma-70 family RNA polymerase sigma factor n=1 Tax=Antrihabitans spumae TaxID=3373370 RepID=A0ABW7JW62_9NOCA